MYSDEQMLREGRGLEKVEVEDTSLEGVEVGLNLIGQDSSPTLMMNYSTLIAGRVLTRGA